jgi:hypothetical protein
MKKRWAAPASGWVGLVVLALGCGADSVNVGDRPEPVGGGSPDAGGSLVEGSTGCNIPNLGQYRLLFDSDGGRLERRIYSMRADGSEIEALTPPEELAREPALSRDGRQLAYATPEGVRLRDMTSGQAALVAPGIQQPTWSHAGTELFFMGEPDGTFAGTGCVGTVTVTNGAIGAITENEACLYTGAYGMSLAIAPDDSSLVLGRSYAREGATISRRLEIIDLATHGGMIIVPESSAPIQQPTISPDSVWVAAAYQCADGEPFALWASPMKVPTPACEGRRITPNGIPSATNPEWGPGVLIAYERGEPPRDIAIIAADTGDECVIEGPGDDRNPSWGVITPSVPE